MYINGKWYTESELEAKLSQLIADKKRLEKIIKDKELADIQSVKHGHWYHNTSKYISELDAYFIQACCSCCGKYSDRVDSYSQLMSNEYCSHCGAKIMGGDVE